MVEADSGDLAPRALSTPVALWVIGPDGSLDGDPPPPSPIAEHLATIVDRVARQQAPASEEHEDGARVIRLVARPLARGGVVVTMLELATRDAALAASEERFGELAQAIDEVFWLTDSDHEQVLYVSPAYEKVWGRTCQSAYERSSSVFEAIDPEDRPRVIARLTTLHAGHYDEVYRIHRPDGSLVWIRDRAFPIRNERGEVVRIAGVAADITTQRRLEEQLVQAQKLESVGRLAGGIAHDFNNLLTVILTGAQFVLRSLPGDSPLREDLVHIKGAGERAAKLTSQLLAFARRQVTEPTKIDLNELTRQTEVLLRRVLGEHIELSTALAPDLHPVLADRAQLEQVLINLAVNARDAMRDGGRLSFTTCNVTIAIEEPGVGRHTELDPGRYVMLAVTDTGGGVPIEILPHIFEPFFTTKRPGQGSVGLGLATCYGIIRQAGGQILACSEPGEGMTFEIILPAMVPGEAALEVSPPKSTKRGDETVLFVEDEAVVRIMGARILAEQGYRVLAAASGPEALRRAAEHAGPIHILVTDVVMPNMSGTELARRLNELRPELRVLYTSGYAEDAVVHPGVLDPQIAFLPKPYVVDTLLAKVREILDA